MWGDELPFITPSDQIWNVRRVSPMRWISSTAADKYRKRIVPRGSCQLTCIGSTIGKVSQAETDCLTNQQINSLVANPEVADSDYLYYAVLHWRDALAALASGSATPIVNKTFLGAVTLPFPEMYHQRAIAEVLGALDDKIAANEKAWRIADDLRRLTFSSGLDDATHVPLSEVARFVNGRPFTKDASGSGRPVIRIAELNSGFGGSTVYNDIEVADDHVARPGDLLFAWSGSLTLRRWYLREGIVNQHIFKVLPAEGWPLWLVASLLERKLDEFKAIAADKATTMGHIQRRHLDDPVPVPTQGWLESNGAKLKSLWDIALAMELESQRLAALRDALLPELMSGRLRVKDVEKAVEEVV